MTITCSACGAENQAGVAYCEICGYELESSISSQAIVQPKAEPTEAKAEELPSIIPNASTSSSPNSSIASGTARLTLKQNGSPSKEFHLDGSHTIVGRYDADTGPVDVDLEGISGDDTVSRNHAEIFNEIGQWKIQDLGSTNGVFIKRAGQTRFGARITVPEVLFPGDEVAFGNIRFLFQSP